MKKKKQMSRKIFELQCEICKSIGHPLRLEILEILKDGEMSASDLLQALDISKANLSKHMGLLVHAGIVDQRREGRQVHYSLTHPEISEACAIMRSILYRRLKQGEELASAIVVPGV